MGEGGHHYNDKDANSQFFHFLPPSVLFSNFFKFVILTDRPGSQYCGAIPKLTAEIINPKSESPFKSETLGYNFTVDFSAYYVPQESQKSNLLISKGI